MHDPIRETAIRNSTKFFTFTALSLLLMLLLAAHAALTGREQSAADTGSAELARRLGLTDLCLFTEARYTRHPAMADLHSPFQDAPASFDYFPSGSLLMPAKRIKQRQ